MSKTSLSLLCLVVLSVLAQSISLDNKQLRIYQDQPNLTDKQILQQALNGLFEQNKLPDPTTIMPCIDDDTAHKIVVFAGQLLDKAAKGSVKDIISLIQLVKDFGNQIPQSVKDCLDGNAQFKALGLKYGITDTTPQSQIEKKIIVYVTLHYSTVHGWTESLNNKWKAAQYYQVGFDAAGYGHNVLGLAEEPNLTDKQILQQALNGLFEQNKLPDPTTIMPCIDDSTAHKIVVFAGQALEKAAAGSAKDLISLIQLVKDFGNQIPQSVKDCLDGNAQFKALGLKYGITDTTPQSQIEKKIIFYITLHYNQVHGWAGSLNSKWKGAQYYQVGFDAAGYGHKVFTVTEEPNLTDKQILQQALNGIFRPNGLPDPITIVPCFDDDSAHKTVAFIGDILHDAAKLSPTNPGEIQKIKDAAQKFGDSLPQAVKDCLNDNEQFTKLGQKYGIDDKTDKDALEKKIIKNLALHSIQVHKTLQNTDNEWHSGKYQQTGKDLEALAHVLIGK